MFLRRRLATRLRRSTALTALLMVLAPAWGQALPTGVRFGMTAADVRAALGPLDRIPASRRATESWRGPATVIGGTSFEQTFVFARGQLARVELLAASPAHTASGTDLFEQMVDWGRHSYGEENRTRDASGEYASWSTPQEDVYVQRTVAGIRLVHTERVQRDPGEL